MAAEVDTEEITVSSKIGKLIIRPVFEGPKEDRHMKGVEIRDSRGKLVQAIDHEVTAHFKTTPWQFDEVVEVRDANDDGFPDLLLDNGGYENFGNHSYDFFCWKPSLSTFVRSKELCEAEISDFDGSNLVSRVRGRGLSEQSSHQWQAGHLRLIEESGRGKNGHGGDCHFYAGHTYGADNLSISYEIRAEDGGDDAVDIEADFPEEGWRKGIWFNVKTYQDTKLVKESRELVGTAGQSQENEVN